MLFGMRRWAIRALELAAIEVTSPTGTEMISMMVQGAKTYRRDFMMIPPWIDDLDGVVMAACSVTRNPSAVNRLAREVGVPPGEAQMMLARLQQAAETLYVQQRPEGHLTQPPWSVGSSLATTQREADAAGLR